jgi:soluble cytochrome b562
MRQLIERMKPVEEGMNARSLERELDKLADKFLEHAELDDAANAIQAFIDKLQEIDDMAREGGL